LGGLEERENEGMHTILVKNSENIYSVYFNIYKQSVTVTNIVETNFEVHNEYNSTFNTQTLGKRNSKDSSKKSASARRKTKRVKLPDSDEDLDDNKNSSESQSTDENPTDVSETPPPRSSPNKEKLLSTPNKRNMHDVEIVR